MRGELPARDRKIGVESRGVDTSRGYHFEKFVLDLNGLETGAADGFVSGANISWAKTRCCVRRRTCRRGPMR